MRENNLKNVLVVYGGVSCEHDISVITGVLALNAMDREKYNAVPLYLTENGCFTGDLLKDLSFYKKRSEEGLTEAAIKFRDKRLWTVKRGKLRPLAEIYCAVNCCHGLNGEDGSVAGWLRLSGIPLASPDMLSSSVYIDKCASKTYLKGLGVNVLPYITIEKRKFYAEKQKTLSGAETLGYPLIVKPARLGSSIGIKLAGDREELSEAAEFALKFDGRIIVEKALENFTEINCAAYGKGDEVIVSECEAPKLSGGFLSFADKYESGVKHALSRDFPAKLPEKTSAEIKRITEFVYRGTFMAGVMRADYLVKGEEVYLNEVNTVPGSLALYLFKDKTSEFKEVLSELIAGGVRAQKDYENGTFTFEADVLNCSGLKNKGAKRSTF